MDFLEFLKNTSSQNDKPQKTNITKKSKHTVTLPTNNVCTNSTINTVNTYKNIRRGEFVKIIYQPNSHLNCYKGYIGEIKEYRKNQDHALIFLHAINSSPFFKFSLSHFIKYDY